MLPSAPHSPHQTNAHTPPPSLDGSLGGDGFRLAAEWVADLVAMLDTDGRYLYANPAHREVIGDPRALPGTDFFERLRTEDRADARRTFDALLRDGRTAPLILGFRTADGSHRRMQARFGLFGAPASSPEASGAAGPSPPVAAPSPQVVVVLQDIAERRNIAEERAALGRLGDYLLRSENLRDVGQVISRESRRIFRHDAFWFDVFDEAWQSFVSAYCEDTMEGESEPRSIPIRHITFQMAHDPDPDSVMATGRPRLINRETNSKGEAASRTLERFGNKSRLSKSLMFAPIRQEGRVVGLVSVQSYSSGRYTRDDLGLLAAFADACSVALLRMRVELERQALARIAQRLAATVSPQELARSVADESRRIFRHDAFCLELVSDSLGEVPFLVSVYAEDTPEGSMIPQPVPTPDPMPPGSLLREVLNGQLALVNRKETDGADESLKRFGFTYRVPRSLMFVPVRWQGRTLGIMSVQSYTVGRFGSREVNLLQMLADQCGGALARVRADEQLRESEQRYRDMFEKNRTIKLVIDPRTGQFADANPAAATYFGHNLEALRQMAMPDLFTLPEADIRNALERAAGERGNIFVFPCRLATGERRMVQVHSSPIQQRGQKLLYSVIHDITDRFAAEQERQVFGRLGIQLAAAASPEAVATITQEFTRELIGWDNFVFGLWSIISGQLRIMSRAEIDDEGRVRLLGTEVVPSDKLSSEWRQALSGEAALSHHPSVAAAGAGQRTSTAGITPTTPTPAAPPSRAESVVAGGKSGVNGAPSAITTPRGDSRGSSNITVPIRAGQNVIGALALFSYGPPGYRWEQLALLQRIADAVAPALERSHAEQALKESMERFALAVQGANDGIWDWDLRTGEVYFSNRWKSMIGAGEDERLHRPEDWLERVHEDDRDTLTERISQHIEGTTPHFEAEYRILHRDGSYRWMLCRGLAVRDESDRPYRLAGSQTDITERKRAEERMAHDALHDALTGLPNRSLLMDRLERAMERTRRRPDFRFAILFLDLDRFKVVNDSLGHLVGDQLLINTAQRLLECVRPVDTVARLGGDEFCILLDDIKNSEDPTIVAERIKKSLSQPQRLRDQDVFTGVSIGIAINNPDMLEAEDLLRDADTAMYRAKELGRGQHVVFDKTMSTHALERLQLESDLRMAIEREELRLFYQPIVQLASGTIAGFEALVRWMHPVRGLLSPGDFLPLAEETGLVIEIGNWVLQRACRDLAAWRKQHEGIENLTMSVNLFGPQFGRLELIDSVEEILRETNLEASRLCLEITETMILQNTEYTSQVFTRLKQIGVQLHIDDFGTGYSSLNYLNQFPVDTLKIDRSFVSRIGQDAEGLGIVKTIISLGRNLNLTVTAEGIETVVQLAHLRVMQCDKGQGMFFSAPVDEQHAAAWIAARPQW